METDIVERIKQSTSFLDLKTIFEDLQAKGEVEKNKEILLFAYANLISYPAIVLTNPDVVGELKAAQWCYDFIISRNKKIFQGLDKEDDPMVIIGKSIMILPPTHALLLRSTEFFELDNLIDAVTIGFTDLDFSNYDGDYLVSAWKNLIAKGYHGPHDNKNIIKNNEHIGNSLKAIQKMKLNSENKTYVSSISSEEPFYHLLEKYYGLDSFSQSGSGCMVFLIVAVCLSFLASCTL